jgi:hypothetical protein
MRVFPTTLSLALFLAHNAGQVAEGDGVTDGGLVIRAPGVRSCCDSASSPGDLHHCVKRQTTYAQAGSDSAVRLLTFVSEGIVQYAAYAVGVNAAYAEHNSYKFDINGHPDRPKMEDDARWNKVRLLWEAVNEDIKASTIERQKYVVWLDADLVVLDMSMRIELVAAQNPKADIIMSRDIARADFVSNSGFVIVRASDWSASFLQKWWSAYDRKRCCDQNAFSWLYDKLDEKEKEHVAILRPDAINSDFPSWKKQKPHNQVLHLAGASSHLYRRPVFELGFAETCGGEDRIVARQLGISRAVLVDHVKQLGPRRVIAFQALKERACVTEGGVEGLSCSTSVYDLKLIKALLEDYVKDDDDDSKQLAFLPSVPEQLSLEQTIYDMRRWFFETYASRHLRPLSKSNITLEELDQLKEAISAGFELVVCLEESSLLSQLEGKLVEQQLVLGRILPLLQRFEDCVPESLQHKALYYRFKHAQLMSSVLPLGSRREKVDWLEKSATTWESLAARSYFGSDYITADPFKEGAEVIQELGTILCSLGDHLNGGRHLARAVELHESTLRGFSGILTAARKDFADCKTSLAESLINLAICLVESGLPDAHKSASFALSKAHSVLDGSESVEANRAAEGLAVAELIIANAEHLRRQEKEDQL